MSVKIIDDEVMTYPVAGSQQKTHYSFWRGEGARFFPTEASLSVSDMVDGLVPETPFISKKTNVVAFGSCFAENIARHLKDRGYNIATKKDRIAYIASMGDGIVNSYAVLQQFQWAWENRKPSVDLWHGYDAKVLGYDEGIRLETKKLLDETECFIITYGLSEVWFDKLTGEVFWRAVPSAVFDAERHGFRTVSHAENLINLRAIHATIRKNRPEAKIVFTLSPIPLTATFRHVSPLVANAASKSSLRSALDAFFADSPANAFYFPSYEIVTTCFDHPWMEDRKHVHRHVIEFIMKVFERYWCGAKVKVDAEFAAARKMDQKVGRDGHWSVPRSNLKWSKR